MVDKKNYVAAHLLQDPKSIETLRETGTWVHIQSPSLPLSGVSRSDLDLNVTTGFIRMGWYGSGVNDPSAGSPTETLLRLLLPLNDKVQATSRR